MISQHIGPGTSYRRTRDRFDSVQSAAKYATRHRGNGRDRREQRCILAALEGVPRGAHLLDLPCGAGRLTWMLVSNGFRVTGADISPHMVAQAQAAWRTACSQKPELEPNAQFEVRDILSTGYRDGEFGAVICNRLFHHLEEPDVRRIALNELRRISTGLVIVSFFSAYAFDSLRLRLLAALHLRSVRGSLITMREFVADARSARLSMVKAIPVRWGISPHWYVVFRPAETATPARDSS